MAVNEMNVFEKSPIRSLDNQIFDFFTRANTNTVEFHEKLSSIINHEIPFCSDCFFGPRVDLATNTIILSMPFLDSLWCSFFAMHVMHEEMTKFCQKHPCAQWFDIQSIEVGKQYSFVLNQFNKILNETSEFEWKEIFVNPTNYSFSQEINDYIKETNQLYVIGVSEILLHECSHVYYGHDFKDKSNNEIRLYEQEADKKANSLLLESLTDGNKEYTIAYSIVLNYLSMLFMGKTNTIIIDKKHPVIQDRIRFLFEGFIENSSIDENTKISLYHLCLQIFDMFLSQRKRGLLSYDNIDDVRRAFYENLDVMDMFVKN